MSYFEFFSVTVSTIYCFNPKLGVPSGKCQLGEFVYLLWNVPIEIFAISFIILEV